jgi:hypothetical protein
VILGCVLLAIVEEGGFGLLWRLIMRHLRPWQDVFWTWAGLGGRV